MTQVSSETLAVSLIEKLQKRKKEIESKQLKDLNRTLVKEWQRLKIVEKEILN